MSSIDLEETIASAVEDATFPAEDPTPDPLDTPEPTPDTTPDPVPETDPVVEPEVPPTPDAAQVASPGSKVTPPTKEQDEFEKKFGIPKESSPGRENRIPYSRVTKIVAKAVKDAESVLLSTHTPKLQEFETKVKDYETRLAKATELETKVANFDKMMIEEPAKFISILKTLPQFQTFFSPSTQSPTKPEAPVDPESDMPQPDVEQPDGSRVYSLDGLKALNVWNRAQARKETIDEVQKLYGPMAKSFEDYRTQAETQRRQQELVKTVNEQIQEAYTWPLFKENEDAIAKVLDSNPKFNLERAYQTIVFPLLQDKVNKARQDALADLKKAPVSTSVSTTGTRPVPKPSVKSGPRDLEDTIREAASAAGLIS